MAVTRMAVTRIEEEEEEKDPPQTWEVEGVTYDDYNEYVKAKRARNQRELDKHVMDIKAYQSATLVAPHKPRSKLKRKPVLPLERRRSKRQKKISAEVSVDEEPLRRQTRAKVEGNKRGVEVTAAVFKVQVTFVNQTLQGLSAKEQANLTKAKPWLSNFEMFLGNVRHGRRNEVCSEQNRTSTLRTISLMASGAGIKYKHWKPNVSFCKGILVSPKSDLKALYQKCIDFELANGRDKSNGWLMKHPIHKLQLFHQCQLEKPYHW